MERPKALGDHHQAMVLFGRGECLSGRGWDFERDERVGIPSLKLTARP